MAYLKNWTDNFFQIFFMGTSWVAVSKTRASSEMTSRKNIKIFDFDGVNVAKHWHVAGRGICHLWLPCLILFHPTGQFFFGTNQPINDHQCPSVVSASWFYFVGRRGRCVKRGRGKTYFYELLMVLYFYFLAPPAERQRRFSNADLSVCRPSVRLSVCLSVRQDWGGRGSASVTFLLFWHGAFFGGDINHISKDRFGHFSR